MAETIVEYCGGCGICRELMDGASCLLFPELYRLFDKKAWKKERITSGELKNLVDLCNFCGLCPCPRKRTEIMNAKHAFVSRDGLDRATRLLEDIERLSKICGAYPRLTNRLLNNTLSGAFLKKLAGIHQDRKLPNFPRENFSAWAEKRGLHIRRDGNRKKVAYFVGCTAQYLFPEVPKAAVDVLERNEIDVYLPEQKCCGMPPLLEGDLKLASEFVAFNVDRMIEAVDSGYEIVCSCPTCAYMLKYVMNEGCFHLKHESERPDAGGSSGMDNFFGNESSCAPPSLMKRIMAASHTFDLGEYLRSLQLTGKFNNDLGPVVARMAYYPPCHLREQMIGEPYSELLLLTPGLSMEPIDGDLDCCGIAGIKGFKRDFHQVSVEMGRRLVEKIRAIAPASIVTDCLSCRIQFNQLLPYKVFHPVEILSESYTKYGKGVKRDALLI